MFDQQKDGIITYKLPINYRRTSGYELDMYYNL